MVRPLACFETAEPLLGRNGDPPGGEIALIFEDRLRRSGVEIAEGVDVHGGYGWSFVAVMEGARIWCLLQLSDEWLLITRPLRSAMDRLRGRSHTEQHARLCGVLEQLLGSGGQFRNVRWYTREEFEGGT